jgi:hypothetical protein
VTPAEELLAAAERLDSRAKNPCDMDEVCGDAVPCRVASPLAAVFRLFAGLLEEESPLGAILYPAARAVNGGAA